MDDFTDEQCKHLESLRSFEIRADQASLAMSCLPKEEKLADAKDDKIRLTVTQVSHLKYGALRYLNTLEAILISWQYGTADKEIIVAQFRYMLIKPGHTILRKFREHSSNDGRSLYPAIELFQTKNVEAPPQVKAQLGG